MCNALPASSDIGLARNVACISCSIAASRTVRLNRKTWSALSIALPCRKLISNCAGPISCDRVSILNTLRFAVRVHVINERIEIVHRIDAVRLAGTLGPAEATLRRLGLGIRIRMRTQQVEFHFRRDDRYPAARLVLGKHTAQHVARRLRHRRAVAVVAIEKHRRRRIRRPWNRPQIVAGSGTSSMSRSSTLRSSSI